MTTAERSDHPPDGYRPLSRPSGLLDLLGPFYEREAPDGLVVAVAAREEHCNRRGFVHGGLLCTLADIAMGYNAATRDATLTPRVTASLDLAFVRPAQCGDWIEAHVEIIKSGRLITLAAARVVVGATVVATGSATFVATGEDAR